jgi:hypothetical protein
MADAVLSRVTNVIAARYDGVAFARFIDDAVRTERKALELNGCGCLLSCHSCKETREDDDGHSHIFPHGPTRWSRPQYLRDARRKCRRGRRTVKPYFRREGLVQDPDGTGRGREPPRHAGGWQKK